MKNATQKTANSDTTATATATVHVGLNESQKRLNSYIQAYNDKGVKIPKKFQETASDGIKDIEINGKVVKRIYDLRPFCKIENGKFSIVNEEFLQKHHCTVSDTVLEKFFGFNKTNEVDCFDDLYAMMYDSQGNKMRVSSVAILSYASTLKFKEDTTSINHDHLNKCFKGLIVAENAKVATVTVSEKEQAILDQAKAVRAKMASQRKNEINELAESKLANS